MRILRVASCYIRARKKGVAKIRIRRFYRRDVRPPTEEAVATTSTTRKVV